MKNQDFLEQLILKLNPDIDDAGLEMLVADAEPVLEEWVFTNIIAKLDSNQRNEIVKVSEKNNYTEWETYKYLSKVIPNYENFIKEVYENFEKMYKTNFNEFKK